MYSQVRSISSSGSRFPADRQTVAIGTSDGVSECRCGCTVGQRKTSQSCSGSELSYTGLVRESVVCTLD